MQFQIQALPAEIFAPMFGLSGEALQERLALRQVVAKKPGSPCRVSLQDAEVGEEVLLVHHVHLTAATPFRAGHAIYVRRKAVQARPLPGEVPPMLRSRLLSVRAFDLAGMMRYADVCEGAEIEKAIQREFAKEEVAFLHLHNARQGCYLAQVNRV